MRDRISEFDQRNAQVLAIAPESIDRTKSYFQRNDITFPCLADPARTVFRQYDVKSALVSVGQRPGLFVIDGEGVVRYAYLGWQQYEIPTVDETLKQLDLLNG